MREFLTKVAEILPSTVEAVSLRRLAEIADAAGIPAPRRFGRDAHGQPVPMDAETVLAQEVTAGADLGAWTLHVIPVAGRHWPTLVRIEPKF